MKQTSLKNNHALIDPKTGLVRNVIIWDGAEWTPPRDHYVVHDCDGVIGDYWDQNNNCFYTINGQRRYRDERGKCGEKPLNPEEEQRVKPHLDKIFEEPRKRLKEYEDQTQLIEAEQRSDDAK